MYKFSIFLKVSKKLPNFLATLAKNNFAKSGHAANLTVSVHLFHIKLLCIPAHSGPALPGRSGPEHLSEVSSSLKTRHLSGASFMVDSNFDSVGADSEAPTEVKLESIEIFFRTNQG